MVSASLFCNCISNECDYIPLVWGILPYQPHYALTAIEPPPGGCRIIGSLGVCSTSRTWNTTMSFQISSSFLFLGGCLSVGLFFAHAYLQYHRNLRIVGSQPGIRTIISTIRPSMMVMPSGKLPFGDWSFSIGPDYWIHSRHKREPYALPRPAPWD